MKVKVLRRTFTAEAFVERDGRLYYTENVFLDLRDIPPLERIPGFRLRIIFNDNTEVTLTHVGFPPSKLEKWKRAKEKTRTIGIKSWEWLSITAGKTFNFPLFSIFLYETV